MLVYFGGKCVLRCPVGDGNKKLQKIIHTINFKISFIVRTKKQQWASSLCHSLVLHTYEEL